MGQEHETVDLGESATYCIAPLGAAIDLKNWADRAKPGATAIYFVGHLAVARDLEAAPFGHATAAKTDALAKHVMSLSDGGLVQLTQRRIDDGCFLYMARRTDRRIDNHG